MSEKKDLNKGLVTEKGGMITGLSRTARLVLRLMGDRRVNIFLKLLPVFSLVYLVSPLDAFIPVVDDALIIGLGSYVFIELSPQDVVEEHRDNIAGLAASAPQPKESDEVIDAIFSEESDE